MCIRDSPETVSNRFRQAPERQLPVSPLAPLVLSDRPDDRPALAKEAEFLRGTEGLGGVDVEDSLYARLSFLGVLPAGPARARGAKLDLRERDL